MPKILISDPLSEKGVEILRKEKKIQVVLKTGLTEEELSKEIPSYQGLIIRSGTRVTAKIIQNSSKLKVIGRAGIGVDNVDLEAASRQGIVVMNTPEGNTITTAEHTLSLMLSLSRKIPQATASMKAGNWGKKEFMGVEVFNKTLGVIGLGRIGVIVAQRALGLKMRVIACDPFISRAVMEKNGVEPVEFEELLKRSDYITLHLPYSRENYHLIGKNEFSLMKPGVRIINCARGGFLDEKALYQAIKEEKVAGAALDVFEVEPPENNPLLALPEVICTPHLGASTDEAQEKVAITIASQMINFLCKGEIRNAVNVPSIEPEAYSLLKPYLLLAEKLGILLSQLVEGGVKKISIKYRGEVIKYKTKLITFSLLKGLLKRFKQAEINLVNAPYLARERGIEIDEVTSSESANFSSLIRVKVKSDKEERRVAGTIYGKNDPRIVEIDDYLVEASPVGTALIFSNIDAPGVIGNIGTFLGKHKINIAAMHLGRTKARGRAISIVNIDAPISKEMLEELRHLPHIVYAKLVIL